MIINKTEKRNNFLFLTLINPSWITEDKIPSVL